MEKILGSTWFTEMGGTRPIGIVIVDWGDSQKAYIGTGAGLDQHTDEIQISQCGASFDLYVARRLIFGDD